MRPRPTMTAPSAANLPASAHCRYFQFAWLRAPGSPFGFFGVGVRPAYRADEIIPVENIEYSTIHVHTEQARSLNNHPETQDKVQKRWLDCLVNPSPSISLICWRRQTGRSIDNWTRASGPKACQWNSGAF